MEGTTTSFPQCKMTTLLPLRVEDYNKRLYDDGRVAVVVVKTPKNAFLLLESFLSPFY